MKNGKEKNTNFFMLNINSYIFDNITNGVIITNEKSVILYVNQAVSRITGYPREELFGKNPGMLHSGHHDKVFYQELWNNITSKGYWEGEVWNRRKSGEIYPELLSISKVNQNNSDNYFYIAVFSDISFLKKDINQKLHLAFYDPLTELANRNLFLDLIKNIAQQVKNSPDKSIAVFYMDLDKFKQVNDTHGHVTGDSLLKLVGKRLSSITRSEDTVARIGGDEFAVILKSDASKYSAIDYAKRILASIEKTFTIDNLHLNISISIGISFYMTDTDDLDELLINADKAMYVAKKSGSKIECFDKEKMKDTKIS